MRQQLLEIVAAVDAEFERNRLLHGERIRCGRGCTDCCHHPFQITDPEAAAIAEAVAALPAVTRETLESRAREYSAEARHPCPALQDGVCSIYEHRPLICHKFGMPIYNPDRPERIFACELNFRPGDEIRDSQLVQIQTSIHREWKELQHEYYASGHYRCPGPITVARAILDAPLWYSGLDG